MYQLLLDSSNKYLAVGISKDGKVIDSIYYEAWQRQSEMMIPEIDKILKNNNIKKEELDAIVVGVGPGSYTGVRIAITIAKTICYALKIKLYSVSSLYLLKHCKNPTICVYNARSGRSYFAVYNNEKQIEKDCVISNEEVLNYISNHKDYVVNGDVEQLNLVSGEYDVFANLVNSINEKNECKNVFELKPIYLKDLM